MKKRKIAALGLALLLMGGCSTKPDTKDKEEAKKDVVEEAKKDQPEKKVTEDRKDYDKIVYEDDQLKISLKYKEIPDFEKYFQDSLDLVFEVENKMDEDIVLQVESLSIDGKMVNSAQIASSTDIHAKKLADAFVRVAGDSREDLPKAEEDIEIDFKVFSWDNDKLNQNIRVEIDLG